MENVEIIKSWLERHCTSLCLDNEDDRETLANILTEAIESGDWSS